MKKVLLGLSIFLIFCFAGSSIAIDDFTVTESLYNGDNRSIQMIVNDNRSSGSAPTSAEASLGGQALNNIEYKLLPDTEVPVTYVFVVDTTTTAYSDQKDKPKEIAEAISNVRSGKNDTYYLISFDTEVHEPTESTKNVSTMLSNLNYSVAGVGDYSAALKKAVDLLNSESKKSLSKKVIILISDGNQIDTPQFKEGDLIEMLANAGYPVYTCGLLQSELRLYIKEDLEKLEKLSKNTGGLFFSYDSNKNPGKDIVNHINRSGVLSGEIDGAFSNEKAEKTDATVQLFRNDNSIATINTQIEIDHVNSILSVDLGINGPANKTFKEKAENWLQDHLGENWMLIVIAGGLLLALVILILLTVAKPKHDKDEDNVNENDSGKTEAIGSGLTARVVLGDMNTGKRYSTTIPDGETRIFGRLDDRNNGIVGIGGDSHISRKQFMMSVNGNMILIEDLGSENGTYLNGSRINGKVGVQNGSVIRVGNVAGEREFSVSIYKA